MFDKIFWLIWNLIYILSFYLKIIDLWSNFLHSLSSLKSITSSRHKAGLDKFISIPYFIFPILERKMNVVAHFIDHVLCSWWLTDNFNFLSWEEVDCIFYWVDLLPITLILTFGVISNQSFQDFISSKIFYLFFNLFGQKNDMLLDFLIFFFHGLVIASDRFGYFFLEIRKKPLNDYKHLTFSFCYSFFEIYLFFFFHDLLLFHLFSAIFQFLGNWVKIFGQISNNFMNAKFEDNFTFQTNHMFFRLYASLCALWYK